MLIFLLIDFIIRRSLFNVMAKTLAIVLLGIETPSMNLFY